jgi:sulfate adenylyltransferase
MLAVGAFSPLDRFMGQADHQRVLDEMRLASGHLFPIPVTLPVNPGPEIKLDQDIALRNDKNELLAVMDIEEIYPWDLDEVAGKVFASSDLRHPLVAEMHRWGKLNISGRVQVLSLPKHYDFIDLRLSPAQTRARLAQFGHANVVAFQTRNPLHRVHEELTKRATQEVDGTLLLHPVVGLTKPGDVDHFTRVRTYKALANRYYAPDRILLALLPLAMRMAGPREAVWHAVIRRNYGANYLIVGRDHAGPGKDSKGNPFYGPYDAQDLVAQFSAELGVGMAPFRQLVYLPDEDRYEEVTRISQTTRTANISGTQVRDEYLNNGKKLPDWFTRPEVADILAESHPPRHKQGVCIWFTGLSNSGKSTTAEVLTQLLQEHGRQVTLLDGDVVRTHFSRAGLQQGRPRRQRAPHRLRRRRAGTPRRHSPLCSRQSLPRHPQRRARHGRQRPLRRGLCRYADRSLRARDVKGMYAKARRGEIKGFTGVDAPYERPLHPELTLDTIHHTAEENARGIVDFLMRRGFIRPDETKPNS